MGLFTELASLRFGGVVQPGRYITQPLRLGSQPGSVGGCRGGLLPQPCSFVVRRLPGASGFVPEPLSLFTELASLSFGSLLQLDHFLPQSPSVLALVLRLLSQPGSVGGCRGGLLPQPCSFVVRRLPGASGFVPEPLSLFTELASLSFGSLLQLDHFLPQSPSVLALVLRLLSQPGSVGGCRGGLLPQPCSFVVRRLPGASGFVPEPLSLFTELASLSFGSLLQLDHFLPQSPGVLALAADVGLGCSPELGCLALSGLVNRDGVLQQPLPL